MFNPLDGNGVPNHTETNGTPIPNTSTSRTNAVLPFSLSQSAQASMLTSASNLRDPVNTQHLASISMLQEPEPEEEPIESRLLSWQNSAPANERQGRETAVNRIRDCMNNGSASLTLSSLHLTSLPEGVFQQLPLLRALNLRGNLLTSLDLHGCVGLASLSCDHNRLTHLDIHGCRGLISFSSEHNQLTHLDVRGCAKLHSLICGHNQLTGLDVRDCVMLTSLSCAFNQLTHLNVRGCRELNNLSCELNQLTHLDLHDCLGLTFLTCGHNQLTHLDVRDCEGLISLSCGHNRLTHFDAEGCIDLMYLSCGHNQLTQLDFSGYADLIDLSCNDNQLAHLNLSGCANLKDLNCSNNQLSTLDLSDCHRWSRVNAQNNRTLRNLSFPLVNQPRPIPFIILELNNTSVRWNRLPQAIRNNHNIRIDIQLIHPRREHQNINQAQNTHTASIHRAASNNAAKLKNDNSDIDIDALYDSFSNWIQQLPIESAAIENSYANDDFKNKAAQEWIQNPSHLDHTDVTSMVSVKEFLALAWSALHDDAQRESSTPLLHAKESLRDALYEIQRGYNFNDAQNPIDNNLPSKNICAGGTFNKISERLVSVVIGISSNFLTQETFMMSLHASIRQAVAALIQNDINAEKALNDDAVDGSNVDLWDVDLVLTEAVWDKIKESVKRAIDEEFQSEDKIGSKTVEQLFNENTNFDNVLAYLSVTPTDHAYTTHLRAIIRVQVSQLLTKDKEAEKVLGESQGFLTQFVWDKIKENVKTAIDRQFQSIGQIDGKSIEQLFNEHAQFERLSFLSVILSRVDESGASHY